MALFAKWKGVLNAVINTLTVGSVVRCIYLVRIYQDMNPQNYAPNVSIYYYLVIILQTTHLIH